MDNKKINEMLFLMERMENYHSNQEVEKIRESFNSRTDTVVIDNQAIQVKTPEDLITVLTKEDMSPKKTWFVTLGYVSKFDKLGDKKISSSIEKFNDNDINSARELNDQILNNILDNPQMNKKGKIMNPYMTDSYTNYIVQAKIVSLQYGGTEAYGRQKKEVENELNKYQEENPEKVKEYLDAKGYQDFVGQSYDDARATSKVKVDNINAHQYDNGEYELNFFTPKTIYKELETKYFLIKEDDENNTKIEEISADVAKSYANLFGVIPVKRETEGNEVVKEVDDVIRQIKEKHHGARLYTQYNLNSVFLLNFATEGGRQKLRYYNPDAVVRYVKGRDLKTKSIPSRYTTKGAFSKYFDAMKK